MATEPASASWDDIDSKKPKKKAPADDTATPAQKEAEGVELVEVDYNGFKVEIPLDQDEWPTLAVQAFSRNRGMDGVEALIGQQKWSEFNARFPKKKQFIEYLNLIADRAGLRDSGN